MNSDLKSVSKRIGEAVLTFAAQRALLNNPQFHAGDLRKFVDAIVGTKVAPGSADRILRMKRQSGELNYTVINRSQSLYKFVPVVAGATAAGVLVSEPVAA